MAYTYKVQSILEFLRKEDEPSEAFQVSEEDNIYCIGTWDEIKEGKEEYELKPGTWVLYDYYDHLWFHFMIHQDHINSSNTLKLDRKTTDTVAYGHVLASWMEETKNDMQRNDQSVQEWEITGNGAIDIEFGHVTSGRGEIKVELRMLRNKKGQLLAVLYTMEDFLEYLNDD